MIGYFVGDQPVRTFVAHTVVRSRQIVLGCCGRGCLYTEGRWDLHIALGDWQTDLYNCTLIPSQAVGFTIFPTFTCARPSKRRIYTTCVAEILVAVPCCRLMFMTYIFRHCGLLILKMISIQAHRNVERESVHVLGVCVCWTN